LNPLVHLLLLCSLVRAVDSSPRSRLPTDETGPFLFYNGSSHHQVGDRHFFDQRPMPKPVVPPVLPQVNEIFWVFCCGGVWRDTPTVAHKVICDFVPQSEPAAWFPGRISCPRFPVMKIMSSSRFRASPSYASFYTLHAGVFGGFLGGARLFFSGSVLDVRYLMSPL